MSLCLRIIRDAERTARFNMAADRFLLERVALSPEICLRFYGWAPPAISIGCMQDGETHIDGENAARAGIQWVKRPTGGRAVLHWDDITYSFVFPKQYAQFGSTISESYALLSRCLMRGLERAGIACTAQDSAAEFIATKRDLKLPCFLSPNRDEIMVKGRKLVGSAQKRSESGVLQHGSIPIDGAFRRLPEFLVLPDEERHRLKALLEKKCICLREIRPGIDKENVIDCLAKGFAEVLDVDVEERAWDPEESAKIKSRQRLSDPPLSTAGVSAF